MIKAHLRGTTNRIQKSHPEHSNIDKIKMLTNTKQIKQQDIGPPNQTKPKTKR